MGHQGSHPFDRRERGISGKAFLEGPHQEIQKQRITVRFFGNFGQGNFGNESTLRAILYHLCHALPDAEVSCICTGPATAARIHNVATSPISPSILERWKPRSRFTKLLRSICVGIPGELYRWFAAAKLLKNTDAFIVPGTGLLTDAYDFRSWGPYGLFKWSLIAKLRGCKLIVISVGAGPIRSRWGRWLTKATLALADFRSYRDPETKDYLNSLGFAVAHDKVYPDLAFSLPDRAMAHQAIRTEGRRVIGLGLMLYHGKLSSDDTRDATYVAYLEELSLFVKWLWDEGYSVRLLIGEVSDRAVVTEFKTLLRYRYKALCDSDRLIDEPVLAVEDLWRQLAQTDAVIATRFHNALLALMLNKPVISVSFHQKCSALMKSMGLEDYCQDIRHLSGVKLIEQFRRLEDNGDELRSVITHRVATCREALDEQYRLIFKDIVGKTSVNEVKRPSAVVAGV